MPSDTALSLDRNAKRVVVNPQRAAAVDYRALAAELQTRLDLTLTPALKLEADLHARLSADFGAQLAEAEGAAWQWVGTVHVSCLALCQ